MVSAVSVHRANCGLSAQNARSKAGRFGSCGRLGSTPRLIANSITNDPIAMSKIDSTKNEEVTVA